MPDRTYRDILKRADAFFGTVVASQPQNLQCGQGCSLCCYGLFEVGSGDVPVIADGLASLHPARRAMIVRRARALLESTAHPDLRESSAEEKEAFFDRTASVPCPALSDQGVCQIYESRPLVCRTFGLPLRNGPEYLPEVCELNFVDATAAQMQAASWDLQNEDELGPEDVFSIPEAIVLAARSRGWL